MQRLRSYLEEIQKQKVLICPKEEHTRAGLIATFGDVLIETPGAWLIPCFHKLYPSASRVEIDELEHAIEKELPTDLRAFLLLANGAKLYIAPRAWAPSWSTETSYIEYQLYNSAELIQLNKQLADDFRSMLGEDPEFEQVSTLNYLAFCDAHDGNYLALVMEGPQKGKVFFLDKEYSFRPYRDQDLYFTVAQTLDSWFERVAKSKGLSGFRRLG